MRNTAKLTLIAGLLAVSGTAAADLTNGPNPYAAGFGFDTPDQAAWGGWSRGDAGTVYAEWDGFVDASYPGLLTAAPDIGQSGTADANLSWNAGTFAAGSGNLYSFSVPETFAVSLTGSAAASPLRAVLQFETWGVQMDYSTLLLNGLAPTYSEQSFYDAAYASSFGPVELVQHLVYWDLEQAAAQYLFNFGSSEHSMSLAQVAIDIGPAPAAAPVPLPAAAWLLGSGLLGLIGLGRRRSQPA
ncbi:VPLPA-CTERM sorting domain-containing protein [Methylomonas methanica]|uniref:Variant PEP-CTERM exosortase signal n=1 Tax=Methylomonas methanica (strain DSM 25384 / MC09) TaxID=857087 RepID=G0A7A3_METMM|nr:VPLPA-CTERM sorting domain-containing protein [Methylomonas methanica]AEF99396.1 variant PEP-CTERM exosortase signal [Methylomonas methanica MC09]